MTNAVGLSGVFDTIMESPDKAQNPRVAAALVSGLHPVQRTESLPAASPERRSDSYGALLLVCSHSSCDICMSADS